MDINAEIDETASRYRNEDEMYGQIKHETITAILRYVKHFIEPGGFVTAVLRNDLKDAIARADMENFCALKQIVTFIYSEAPSTCWGTVEKVNRWLAQGKGDYDDAN